MPTMLRDISLLTGSFLGTTAIASAAGAANLGTAAGIGQLAFTATLVWILARG
jgi:hypothetical protein